MLCHLPMDMLVSPAGFGLKVAAALQEAGSPSPHSHTPPWVSSFRIYSQRAPLCHWCYKALLKISSSPKKPVLCILLPVVSCWAPFLVSYTVTGSAPWEKVWNLEETIKSSLAKYWAVGREGIFLKFPRGHWAVTFFHSFSPPIFHFLTSSSLLPQTLKYFLFPPCEFQADLFPLS